MRKIYRIIKIYRKINRIFVTRVVVHGTSGKNHVIFPHTRIFVARNSSRTCVRATSSSVHRAYSRFQLTFERAVRKFVGKLRITFHIWKIGRVLRYELRNKVPNFDSKFARFESFATSKISVMNPFSRQRSALREIYEIYWLTNVSNCIINRRTIQCIHEEYFTTLYQVHRKIYRVVYC